MSKKQRNKLDKEEISNIMKIMKDIGENGRLCYVLNCNIIQTLIKVYYNRIIEIYAIHRWFIRNYINKIKELEFPKMAKDFINEKYPMLKWNEEEFCKIFSSFKNTPKVSSLLEYSEYVINKDLQENYVDKVYKFIVDLK
ncbi:MAG: hypothetical protein SOT71_07900 [Romboutsia timonensis]|uniref:hypothetical protein n=1 Tax=Romboutsia timonensis TaxID=1776391 RepID=UPI002A756ACC|nr:hypothetical protein [Romboutsia timonensis]MDY2882560.1 hypothetical protein [Romboutsia timonensis]